MTEPVGGDISIFGGTPGGPQETDASLDELETTGQIPQAQALEDIFYEEPPVPVDLVETPVEAGEEEPSSEVTYEEEDDDDGLSLFERVRYDLDYEEPETQAVDPRVHEAEVRAAALQARLEAIEQNLLQAQPEVEQVQEPTPVNYASPEVLAALRDRFPDIAEDQLPELARTLGVFAETAAENKIRPLQETFQQQQMTAEEAATFEQQRTLATGNMDQALSMAEDWGDAEALEIVQEYVDSGADSLLFEAIAEDPAVLASPHAVLGKILELARDVRAYDLGEAQDAAPESQSAVSNAPLVGSREEVTAALSRASQGDSQTTQPAKTAADELWDAVESVGAKRRSSLGVFSP